MDILPKLSDIKNLKDLSKVIVLPLLCACYISQSDFSLSGESVFLSLNNTDSTGLMLLKVTFIFLGKTMFSAILFILIYVGIAFLHFCTKGMALPFFMLILLTFGFLGIFAGDKVTAIFHMQKIWYFASFVTAFFFLEMTESITLD
ncbi:hypothetical protein [Erwinia mallotivora]|uniref:hypothetical protein n=1 Tax=Erwinia mallotivora TaxID=69222 RepID=UPI0021BE7DA1|nr:hypothetical protein [Erwinia mallotivora]